MKIDYIRIEEKAWEEVKDSALTTINKSYTGLEITEQWKMDILKAEHSPIRELMIHVKFSDIPRFVADQIVRHHIGFTPYMSTMRPDRTIDAKPRSEQRMTDMVELKLSMNAQAIINISRDRLCVGKVTKETRELWEMFLKELEKQESELVFYCVPPCIYRCGCKEIKPCDYFERLTKFVNENLKDFLDINSRYLWYWTIRKILKGNE